MAKKPSSSPKKQPTAKVDPVVRALAAKGAGRAVELRDATPIPEGQGVMLLLGLLAILLTGARLLAGKTVGFGDSEALYASYAFYPQASYLDHPGLIALFARVIGAGRAPTPADAHLVTTTLSMFTPWLGFAAARAYGQSRRAACIVGIALTVAPVMAVGLFAMTPDLLLAPLWLASLALAISGLRARAAGETGSRVAVAFVFAGLLAGIAASAKVSGLCLMLTLAIVYARTRKDARTPWAWVGLAIGCIVLVPIVRYESTHGFPMLHHRFVVTQRGGPDAGRAATTIFGQLLYVSPVFCILAIVIGRRLFLARKDDAATSLLATNMLVSLAVLVPVCIFARTSEPHWLAPVYLPIAIYAGTQDPIRFGRKAAYLAAAMSAFVYAWVLSTSLSKLWPTDPKADITNELFGWPSTLTSVIDTVEAARTPLDSNDVVVVGLHWTVCGQLRAGLPREIDVGCTTHGGDDWDTWLPREQWMKRGTVILVTTDQLGMDRPEELFPDFAMEGDSRVSMFRGGRPMRVFHIIILRRRAKV